MDSVHKPLHIQGFPPNNTKCNMDLTPFSCKKHETSFPNIPMQMIGFLGERISMKNWREKKGVVLGGCILAALLAVPVMLCGLTLTAEGSTPKVIIDPGHGGFDPGAIGEMCIRDSHSGGWLTQSGAGPGCHHPARWIPGSGWPCPPG